ncbi:uncharacterized protein PADG_07426 [Paracoccidioides brasiliensis Pb18]|uniref:Mmc1 C-terminal domain-containing protein n=1 Tax=Paracoccidioides brasiliensis (strain Pb18) TaxID=502780 RepID=C1GJJ0_PARBD|nr:uncharacterized protein PADG_07426 [Paracoccidioides brasiliensis Pb18]EEH42606.1 hypothetical protein PADG_07426 [Paracoccidioides brasiliensis Pb18]
MPPKLHPSLSIQAILYTESFFFCPSCSTWRRSISSQASSARYRNLNPTCRSRSASTFAPPSTAPHAINVTRNIPERFQELYSALRSVYDVAATHVNPSRLQLALRGLETEMPVIRVAVLGLDNTSTTARLVRLLLADPLSPKQEWENYLETYRMDTSRGLLIKYGERTDLAADYSLVPTISVPSIALKAANLEILVSPLGASLNADSHITSSTFLVPTIAIQSTSTGAHTLVRYPVHKSIVCGKGIDGLLAYMRLVERANTKEPETIRAAFELNLNKGSTQEKEGISFVNIDRAEAALDTFRKSVQNATEYEKGWLGSGVQPLIEWMSAPSKAETLDPSIRRLVGSVLDGAEESIIRDQHQQKLVRESKTVPEEVRMALQETVSSWAERAHTELRDTLNQAFASKPWRTLSWWKLFWHVDDVGVITSRILRTAWLPEAENGVIWIGGKIHQAGLLNHEANPTLDVQESPESKLSSSFPKEKLWPTQIPDIRHQLSTLSVPSLHALAQKLVLFSVSTTALSSALSALVYVSSLSSSVYEAGTIATIGLFVSLRQQQKGWDAARGFWEREVCEEGRRALKDTEESLRTVIYEGGRAIEAAPETEALQQINRARQALSDVK